VKSAEYRRISQIKEEISQMNGVITPIRKRNIRRFAKRTHRGGGNFWHRSSPQSMLSFLRE
jgi:hypothetical protein